MTSSAINTDFKNQPKQFGVNPLKFIVWLFIVSITMMFAAFTSAYIVRQAEGNWQEFEFPTIMLFNTLIIVLSSATMQWAFFAAKKDNLKAVKIALFITFAAGIAFL